MYYKNCIEKIKIKMENQILPLKSVKALSKCRTSYTPLLTILFSREKITRCDTKNNTSKLAAK